MDQDIIILLYTAASLGFIHTLVGPDHYIPFIAMAKSNQWSFSKTCLITAGCGIAHVFSSVLIGAVGIGLSVSLQKLQAIEASRGNLAGWLLVGFGLFYLVWGLKKIPRKNLSQETDWLPAAQNRSGGKSTTKKLMPWIIFTIFLFGPCEILIPLLIVPAAAHSWSAIFTISLVFGAATVATMLSITLIAVYGLNVLRFKPLEKYSHALAGFGIFISGLLVQFGM